MLIVALTQRGYMPPRGQAGRAFLRRCMGCGTSDREIGEGTRNRPESSVVTVELVGRGLGLREAPASPVDRIGR
jgi:hypothetical protein